jgi:hypothetical protein
LFGCSQRRTKTDFFQVCANWERISGFAIIGQCIWSKYEGKPNESTKYRIVEDTDIGLVAIHAKADMEGKKPEVYVVNYVVVIMINKVSGDFRQRSFTTIEEAGYDIRGSCQAGE